MDKKDFWSLIILIIGGLMYSIVSFAYMHNNFSSKDMLERIHSRLDRIENKIDNINGGK